MKCVPKVALMEVRRVSLIARKIENTNVFEDIVMREVGFYVQIS